MAHKPLVTCLSKFVVFAEKQGLADLGRPLRDLLHLAKLKKFTRATLDTQMQISSRSSDGTSASTAAAAVSDFIELLDGVASKSVVNSLGELRAFLERQGDVTIEDIKRELQQPGALVDSYARSLSGALGGADFMPLFNQLKADPKIKKADLIEIMHLMGSEVSNSLTKRQLLDWLVDRHQKLESYRAKSRAMDGRSAA